MEPRHRLLLARLGGELATATAAEELHRRAVRGALAVVGSDRAVLLLAPSEGTWRVAAAEGCALCAGDARLEQASVAARLDELLGPSPLLAPLAVALGGFGILAARRMPDLLPDPEAAGLLAGVASLLASRLALAEAAERHASLPAVELALRRLVHDVRSSLNASVLTLESMRSGLMGPVTGQQIDALEQLGRRCRQVAELLDERSAQVRALLG